MSVETSRPLTSLHLEHLSVEITASKIDSRQRREAVIGQPLADGKPESVCEEFEMNKMRKNFEPFQVLPVDCQKDLDT